jgi:Holliday junction resolvase RusA-like endonuclease
VKIRYDGKLVGNNARYKYRTHKVLTAEYKQFKEDLGWLLKAECKGQECNDKDDFIVRITFNSKHDIDGLAKGILDSAEGIVYKNDRQVKKLDIEKTEIINHKLIVEIEKKYL